MRGAEVLAADDKKLVVACLKKETLKILKARFLVERLQYTPRKGSVKNSGSIVSRADQETLYKIFGKEPPKNVDASTVLTALRIIAGKNISNEGGVIEGSEVYLHALRGYLSNIGGQLGVPQVKKAV